MVYYANTGQDNSESLLIEPVPSEPNKAALLVTDFNTLQNFDFKNFNYFLFEQDIQDLTAEEFEWWYQEVFNPWLFQLNDEYFDLEFDDFYYKFGSQLEKKIFLLKIVNFIMFLLPYQYLRDTLHNLEDYIKKHQNISNSEVVTTSAIINFLDEDTNLILLREELIKVIQNNTVQFETFIKLLLQFEKIAKKNLVEENINLLDEHIKKQNFFLELFQDLIQETDMHKFKKLVELILNNDSENIL